LADESEVFEMENPVQLRLGFDAPSSPQRWLTTLAGTMVTVVPQDGDFTLTMSYLAAIGVSASQTEDGTVTVPVRDLHRFSGLPGHVTVVPRGALTILVTLLSRPPVADQYVVVSQEPGGGFNLSWFDGRVGLNEQLPHDGAAAFVSLEVPFVADPSTWDELLSASQLPVLLGRARINLDGFVEVVTSKPQKVEASPLRALFKLDDTRYGLPLAYAEDLSAVPGFVWEGRRPTYDQAPGQLPDLGLELSEHVGTDLNGLVARLASSRAEVVVWDSGLGRRVFALAAVAALEAFPLLIVTSPHAIWAWQRHLDLLGRSWSLTHDRTDVQIVTYRDLVVRRDITSPAAMILDDLDRVTNEQRAALRRFDGVLDTYRLACCSSFPETAAEGVRLMSALRPAEFRDDVPLLSRYPLRAENRAREHVDAYISRREKGPGSHGFRRSSVEVLEPAPEQMVALERAAVSHGRSPEERLSESLSLLSSGSTTTTGPKVARAVEIARDCVREGNSVAIVTRHPQTAKLLRLSLRPVEVDVVDRADAVISLGQTHVVVVVSADGRLPDLRDAHTVVLMDYLWSSLPVDASVGSAHEKRGTLNVVQLHLRDTIDDRCALLAARRRELGPVIDPYSPPSTEEMFYLLSDRG
jgi:hypothetical protein